MDGLFVFGDGILRNVKNVRNERRRRLADRGEFSKKPSRDSADSAKDEGWNAGGKEERRRIYNDASPSA